MDDVKRILVVSRATNTCRKAIHCGIDLAKESGATVTVIHSLHDPFSIAGWDLPLPSLKTFRDDLAKTRQRVAAELNELVDAEKATGIPIRVSLVEGPLVEEIVRMVEAEKIDVLVMVAFDEGRIEHFFYGSSIQEIVRRLPCSILLVKEFRSWEQT
jgi:universal stress protein A